MSQTDESPRAGPGGRYELREKLGEGGAGTVYKAWDSQLQRFVAFKRLRGHDLSDDSTHMLKEAKTLASIQHPNILTLFDCGEDAEGAFVVTEFLQGEPIDFHIRRVRYHARNIGDLITQTLEGLIAAHHVHIIHRDIKPSNIMAVTLPSGAWQYKILDFGLARILSQPTSQTIYDHNSIYGSIHYLSPEQIKRQPLDERTDLYALGCVYYYALAGHPPFQGESIMDIISAHLDHRFMPLQEERSDLPADLCEWITRLMSPEPDDRPASAKEALDNFYRIHARLMHTGTMRITAADTKRPAPAQLPAPGAVPHRATKSISVAHKSPPRRRAVLAAAGVAVAGALAGLVFFQTQTEEPPALAPEIRTETATIAPMAPPPQAPTLVPAPILVPMPDYFSEMDRPEVLRAYFEKIKDLDFDYGKLGSVGEGLALVQFQEKYADDPNLECFSGLHYEGTDGNTAGELDLIVWRRDKKQAVAVYEIKVSDNLEGVLGKAHSQLRRFQGHVRTRAITRFNYPSDGSRVFKPEQFDAVETYGVIGSRGAAAVGYEVELDLSRAEAAQLQKALLHYRKPQRESLRFTPRPVFAVAA